MFYIDLYFPHVAEGMIVRLGRYISLPDIEAQLAPNNYTYTHSLTYTYDCYTQTGLMSPSSSPNTLAFKPVFHRVATRRRGSPALSGRVTSANNSNGAERMTICTFAKIRLTKVSMAYNNLAAYYVTWYHKFNDKWHTASESWYQYESHTPNIFNPAAADLIITGHQWSMVPDRRLSLPAMRRSGRC